MACDNETSPLEIYDWSVSFRESDIERIILCAMIQLAGIDLIWRAQSLWSPCPSSGLTQPHFSHVQSIFVMSAMVR